MLTNFLPGWERSIFEWIYSWPDFLAPMFVAITQFGSWYALALVALLTVVFRKKILIRLLSAGVISVILTWFAKILFGRGRPDELIQDVVQADIAWSGAGGFPSGHTSLIVAFGVILLMHLPRFWRIPLIFVMLSVAVSRIYLGMHLPLDIVGGAVIGLIAAALAGPVTILTAKLLNKR